MNTLKAVRLGSRRLLGRNSKLVLKANPGHYHYHPMMPQTVKLIPTKDIDGPGLLERGEVDLVTTAEYYQIELNGPPGDERGSLAHQFEVRVRQESLVKRPPRV